MSTTLTMQLCNVHEPMVVIAKPQILIIFPGGIGYQRRKRLVLQLLRSFPWIEWIAESNRWPVTIDSAHALDFADE